ncbi:protein prune homolog 2 isoform X2 [Aricia agestis]|uniref:protein prune homolog 2 isoform X2 n=1 Tax=Aricia agestis TaxID=91739 RepID=UPI001C20BD02|nr:protein prune homolog 2 isoform X2 [Aricia agestis]
MNRSLLSSEEDILSSPSSDDKMDTSSESFQTNQDTPNSTQSEFEDRGEELQVQNPNVLRLSEPVGNASNKMELNDSLITKMSKLTVDSPDNRPRNLGISPPKLSSTLTSTTSHPLMILNSPDENFPDLIPKKSQKLDEEKDLSLSSIEDEKANTNGYEFYTPQRNTSKNNLYYSENFVTADSNILTESLNTLTTPPDVARVDQRERRKISARYLDNPKDVTPQKNLSIFEDNSSSAMKKYLEKKISSQSTPKPALNISEPEEFHSGVADWCDSPSQLRAMPNFDLPIEMSSNITAHNDLDSPDVVSSSTAEDKSAYQALLDPYTGSVALRPTGHKPPPPRRKVQVPQEEDSCSLDSVSGCSMESEDEPPPPAPPAPSTDPHSDDDTKRSKSTMTLSECSDPIPEYSAAEELQDERAWLTVKHGGRQSKCDMKVIEEFKRVVSHGGYDAGGAALIVFSACHLPDTARPDYRYVMDNLFLYVIWSLERLVTEEYVLVYLHGSAGRRRLPSAAWLHECYKLIDRRLRKSLKHLYLVHPTFWLKSFVIITKPFVSSKFFRKLSYVKSLAELYERVPVEPNAIPEIVKQYDARR